MTRNYIGIDLSKDRLDIFEPEEGRAFPCENAPAAIRAFLARRGPEDVLVFEATSGCDRALIAEAVRAGRPFVRLNPLHAWHFARSLNLPKTDRVDARMLARLGRERQPEPHRPPAASRAELAALAGRRDELKRMETQEKNRLADAGGDFVACDIRASLRALAARIARIEAEIEAHLARHPDLARDAALLRAIPGVGPVVATGLLAHLPELGHLDRRRIASLGGLAPRARESGKFAGKRRIGDGRRHIRRLLYMASLSAARAPGLLADCAERMKAAGKPGKVILIAIARRLLVLANAILRDRTPYRAVEAG